MALIAGARSYHQVHATVRAGFLPVMKISWVTSPLALAFAQKFLPEQTWVPFFNVVSFIIGTYINAHTKKKRLAALRRKVSNHRIPSRIAQILRQPSTMTIEHLVEQATIPDRTIRTGQCRCILLAFGWFVYWMYRTWLVAQDPQNPSQIMPTMYLVSNYPAFRHLPRYVVLEPPGSSYTRQNNFFRFYLFCWLYNLSLGNFFLNGCAN